MDDYNNNSGRDNTFNNSSLGGGSGGGFDDRRGGAGGLGGGSRTGDFGNDSYGSSGRDNLGSTGDDSYGSDISGGGAGLGRDNYGGGVGSDNLSGRTGGGLRDNNDSYGQDMSSARDDPRTADTNYAGAPIRSGPFTGTDSDTYGSTGTGRGLGGSNRVTDTSRDDKYGVSGTGRYDDDSALGGQSGAYGSGTGYGNTKGSGTDSTLGKFVEKVGDVTKSAGLQEKGRDMREKKGFDGAGSGSYDDPSFRSGSGRNNDY